MKKIIANRAIGSGDLLGLVASECKEVSGMQDEIAPMVRNFRNGAQWDVVILNYADVENIQRKLRKMNKQVVEESMRDAEQILASYAGPYEGRTARICQLAMFLASKRIVDVKTVHAEYLRTKIWKTRNGNDHSGQGDEVRNEEAVRNDSSDFQGLPSL